MVIHQVFCTYIFLFQSKWSMWVGKRTVSLMTTLWKVKRGEVRWHEFDWRTLKSNVCWGEGSKGWRWVPGKRHTPMLAVSYYAPWLTSMNHPLSTPSTMTAMLSAESRRKRIIRGGSYLTRKWIMEMIGLLISGRGQTWAHWTMEQDHINLNTPKDCKTWLSGSTGLKELVLARVINLGSVFYVATSSG